MSRTCPNKNKLYNHHGIFFSLQMLGQSTNIHDRRTIPSQQKIALGKIILQEETWEVQCILLGCHPECTTWQLTAEHHSRSRCGRHAWSGGAGVRSPMTASDRCTEGQSAIQTTHPQATEDARSVQRKWSGSSINFRHACIFLFLAFSSQNLVSLFIPFPHISIAGSAGSAACNCLCSPAIMPVAQPTTDEQLKVARLTLEDTQSYSGLSSFLLGLADHSHTLRQPW